MTDSDLRLRIGADARRLADLALAEDGPADLTSAACVAPGQTGVGVIEFRDGGILAGTVYADAVAHVCGIGSATWNHPPGSLLSPGMIAGVLRGDLGAILRAERPLLNMLQRAVGIATTTRAFVDAVAGTRAKILHTRKTAPGLRLLDVSAVLAGGGAAHRLDLATTAMVKDNHWHALARGGRSLAAALAEARRRGATECFVEVESQAQAEAACAAGADRLLVDNQPPEMVHAWGALARERREGIAIEATGGITLANVRAYAEAGADYISVGALTHSVTAANIALELEIAEG